MSETQEPTQVEAREIKPVSPELQELIDEFATQCISFTKVKRETSRMLNKIIELAEKEGLGIPEIRALVDATLEKRQLSERQRLRYLPSKLKRGYHFQSQPQPDPLLDSEKDDADNSPIQAPKSKVIIKIKAEAKLYTHLLKFFATGANSSNPILELKAEQGEDGTWWLLPPFL